VLSTYISGAGCYLRRRQVAILLSGLLLTLGGCKGCTGPLTYDASPDAPNGGPPCSSATSRVSSSCQGQTGGRSFEAAISHLSGWAAYEVGTPLVTSPCSAGKAYFSP
jgi:hypothetical protein